MILNRRFKRRCCWFEGGENEVNRLDLGYIPCKLAEYAEHCLALILATVLWIAVFHPAGWNHDNKKVRAKWRKTFNWFGFPRS